MIGQSTRVIACPDCDLLLRLDPVPPGGSAHCVRCGAGLRRKKRNSIDRSLAFAITAGVAFLFANSYPLLTFNLQGRSQENWIISGVIDLFAEGFWALAALVFVTSVLAPLFHLLGMVCLLVPFKLGRRPRWLASLLKLVLRARACAMVEVYMLGILVAYVKLSDFGSVVPGTALYGFGLLIAALVAMNLAFDPDDLWDRLEAA